MVVNKQFLQHAGAVLGLAKSDALVPILEYVLIAPVPGDATHVYVTAKTYSTEARVKAPVIKTSSGPACLHAPTLLAALKSMPWTGEVEITKGSGVGMGVVIGDGAKIEFPMLPAGEFRGGTEPSPHGISYTADQIREALAMGNVFSDPKCANVVMRCPIVGPEGMMALNYNYGLFDKDIKATHVSFWPLNNKEVLTSMLDLDESWQTSNVMGDAAFCSQNGHYFVAKSGVTNAQQEQGYLNAKRVFDNITATFISNFSVEAAILQAAMRRMILADSLTMIMESTGFVVKMTSTGNAGFSIEAGAGQLKMNVEQEINAPCVAFKTTLHPKTFLTALSAFEGTLNIGIMANNNPAFPPLVVINSQNKIALIQPQAI